MGRQGATYSFKVKEITTGKTKLTTYNAGTTLEQADVQTVTALFLYKAADSFTFMINDTSEMVELEGDVVEEIAGYLKENLDVYVMMFEGNVLGVILPNSIDYVITETVPGMKGNRAQAGKKPATIETGMEIQVPLHKNE
jgi:elongation factor P